MKRVVLVGLFALLPLCAQQYTRGVGVYPGDPAEDFSPSFQPDASTYRNLALHRPAYHSSSYDYNLTAQLVTDGIRETALPRWVVTSTSRDGVLKKNQREWLLDDNWVTAVNLQGKTAWVQIEFGGGDGPPEIDRVNVDATVRASSQDNQDWACTVLGSDDGNNWRTLGVTAGMARPTGEIHATAVLKAPARLRFYRLQFDSGRALQWQIGEVAFFNGAAHVHAGGPYYFTSAWMTAGGGGQWVYVDLGAPCKFDRVALHWIRRAAEGAIQISDDATKWTTVEPLPSSTALTDDIKLRQPATARYVRLLMTKPASEEGYILSEMEVYGTGGPVPRPKPAPAPRASARIDLAGGAWKLQRDSLVHAGGAALSQPGFDDQNWVIATVPATILTSYYNAGAVPDPNYGDNQLMISDSFFYADFWYRDEFTVPASAAGRRHWLNFDGVNWKADVFLNGEKLGRIEGGFTRARFDVTSCLRPGQVNALAVRIEKNATPGSIKEKTFDNPDKNGGALGADNPTYHASVGWDWIPTIRGRDTGLWNDVFLTSSGPVTIEDPFVTTTLPLPDTSRADVHLEVTLRNHQAAPVSGTLHGRFGDVRFDTPVTLDPSSAKTVKLDPSTHPALRLQNPRLWWPTGYGDPNLYNVELRFELADKSLSDDESFQAGVRQFTYSEEGGALRIWINGRRFVARGGNWGFPESMLRYRGREYETAVRYHRDMHFTMIRNWVGQTGDDEFYEACDRNGVVVWQDFWLANPWDGPEPNDNEMFMRNVRDTLLRIRNHPSIGLYCGRNEGDPLPPLDHSIRAALAEVHPGIHYISSSADGPVSGHGPYRAMPVKSYFQQRATPLLHSEMGMPNIVTYDSLQAMMPASAMWPQGAVWGIHDFCLNGAQGGASFRGRIDKGYGGANSAAEWVTLAQFVNYEGYRAMFEAQSKNRMGLLIWMSHPSWPSFVWQTYDYYFDPTAGYFGCKKGSQPLHIQWNPATDNVEVVNYSAGNATGLTARIEILNLDGSLKWDKSATLDSPEDSVQTPIRIEFPSGLTSVHFLRLKLTRAGAVVSENFYWRGLEEGDFRALRQLPKVRLQANTQAERQGDQWILTTELQNVSAQPALMVHLKAVRETSGDRILPALYEDNFISLMPGERRTIRTELEQADTRGERPRIAVEGFNVGEVSTR
jgi:hypothetical protein